MEAEPKSSNPLGRSPVMNQPYRHRPSPTLETERSREVVHCRRCLLVQFRTLSNFCRRCSTLLPPPQGHACDASTEQSLPEPSVPAPAAVPAPVPDCRFRARKLAVGHVVRTLRKQRRLTQEQMAGRLGIPRSYISRIENRRVLPGPPLLSKIAAALAVEISDLLRTGPAREASPFSEDPTQASLLAYFLQLRPSEKVAVLSAARRMLANKAVPARQGNLQPCSSPDS